MAGKRFCSGIERVKSMSKTKNELKICGKVIGSWSKKEFDGPATQYIHEYLGIDEYKWIGGKRFMFTASTHQQKMRLLEQNKQQIYSIAIHFEDWQEKERKILPRACWKCNLFGHGSDRCNYALLCKYCGMEGDHESRQCGHKDFIAKHFCAFCDQNGHFINERDYCNYYLKEIKKIENRQSYNKNIEQELIDTTKYNEICANHLLLNKITTNDKDLTIIGEQIYTKQITEIYKEKYKIYIKNKSDSMDIRHKGQLHKRQRDDDESSSESTINDMEEDEGDKVGDEVNVGVLNSGNKNNANSGSHLSLAPHLSIDNANVTEEMQLKLKHQQETILKLQAQLQNKETLNPNTQMTTAHQQQVEANTQFRSTSNQNLVQQQPFNNQSMQLTVQHSVNGYANLENINGTNTNANLAIPTDGTQQFLVPNGQH